MGRRELRDMAFGSFFRAVREAKSPGSELYVRDQTTGSTKIKIPEPLPLSMQLPYSCLSCPR